MHAILSLNLLAQDRGAEFDAALQALIANYSVEYGYRRGMRG